MWMYTMSVHFYYLMKILILMFMLIFLLVVLLLLSLLIHLITTVGVAHFSHTRRRMCMRRCCIFNINDKYTY